MPHVGHIRSAIAFDQLTRWLEYRGFRVTVVRNVTDIDDKILAKSAASFDPDFEQEPGAVPEEEWWALAYRYEQEFLKAYDTLGVSRPTYEPRATGHIPEMHALIQQLIDRGHAYPALDGSGDVYFDVRSWNKYGSLTRQKIDDMQGATDADPRGKKDPRDFALWKGHKEGEPTTASWALAVGRRPSGLAPRMLRDGHQVPRHRVRHPRRRPGPALPAPRKRDGPVAGGRPRRSPTSGCTTAWSPTRAKRCPSRSATPSARPKCWSWPRPRVVRYYLGQAQYRSVLDYQPTSLQEAAAAVERIDGFIAAGRSVHCQRTAPAVVRQRRHRAGCLRRGHGRRPQRPAGARRSCTTPSAPATPPSPPGTSTAPGRRCTA